MPFREALEHFLKRHATFETRQYRADAGVDAMPEGEMRSLFAMNVEGVTVGVAPVVTVGGADQQHHRAACGHGLAMKLDVPSDKARDRRARRLVAQEFLDRLWDERWVVDEVAPLIRMVGEFFASPTDQAVGGFVAGPRDHVDD